MSDILEEMKTLEQLGVADWTKIYDEDEVLLFVKWYDQAFDFMCVEWGCEFHDENKTTLYQVLFEGIALFDGIRHLYFGSEKTKNYGYLYYQEVERLAKALMALRQEELKLDYVQKAA